MSASVQKNMLTSGSCRLRVRGILCHVEVFFKNCWPDILELNLGVGINMSRVCRTLGRL